MTVLITRNFEDSLNLSKRIQGLGIKAFIEPIIKIIINPSKNIDYSKYDFLVFTSRNAVKYLQSCDYTNLLHKKCFAIGDATKNMLSTSGFKDLVSADNSMDILIQKIIQMPKVHEGLYFRGEIISKDLRSILSANGIKCDEEICYSVSPADNLSDDLIVKIKNGEFKVILFFSKNTAETFLSLCNEYDIAKFLKKVTILTVSKKISDYIHVRLKNETQSFDGKEDFLLELIRSCYV